jgi:hypothetical protein
MAVSLYLFARYDHTEPSISVTQQPVISFVNLYIPQFHAVFFLNPCLSLYCIIRESVSYKTMHYL